MGRRPLNLLRSWRARCVLLVGCCAPTLLGCQSFQPTSYTPPEMSFAPPAQMPNPVVVTAMDRDYVWDQVVDVVDDYFRIQKEDRVQLMGDLLTEGKIETYPRGASTIFEPWNKDSVTAYDRWEATAQSLRRRALVRVIPSPEGFLVDVQVFKELEDVVRPESGAVTLANAAALRNDNSLKRVESPVAGQQMTLGWIPQGRDVVLEQTILAHIQSRLAGSGAPQAF
ncbi:MAG: hypothetical protein AB7O59_13200 [Pirellulales bacterium]